MTRFLPSNPRARAAVLAGGAVALFLVLTLVVFPGAQGAGRGTPMAILFQGATSGLVLALPACGVVLLYRTLRIVNFAQTALGIAGALLTFELIQYTPVPFVIAFPLGLAVSVLTGVVIGVFTLRYFRSSRLFLTVVSILVAQTLAGLSARLIVNLPFFPAADERTTGELLDAQNVDALLPLSGLRFQVGDFPLKFGFGEVFAIEMAILSLAGLGFFLRYTRSGVAVRALSENAERASLLGVGVGQLSIVVWGLAGLLSGIGIILNGAITNPASATGFNTDAVEVLLVVLASAVIGGMVNLPVAIGSSVLLTSFANAFAFSYDDHADLFLFLLFLAVSAGLIVQGRRITRSEASEGISWAGTDEPRPVPKELAGIPSLRWARLALVGGGLLLVVLFPFVASTGQVVIAGVVAINAIAVMSLVVLTGWAGQVSMGQYAFVTIGAVVGGALTARTGWPFWVAVPIASAVCGVLAALVGLPALRIRGLFLLVATFAFATAVQANIFNERYFDWLLPEAVDRPSLFFLDFEEERSMYFLAVASLALSIAIVGNLRRSRVGRLLIALRENEANVKAFGITAVRAKLMAFGISGAMAGFAGVLLSHQGRGVTAATYNVFENFSLFIAAVVGGVSSPAGALLGAAFIYGAEDLITSDLFFSIWSNGLPILLIFAAPGGLVSLVNAARDSVLRIVAQRRQIIVPSLFADYDPGILERRLIPLGDPLDNGGLAALPTSERFVMVSELYQGRGERLRDRIGPARESDETVAIGAAARAAAELEV